MLLQKSHHALRDLSHMSHQDQKIMLLVVCRNRVGAREILSLMRRMTKVAFVVRTFYRNLTDRIPKEEQELSTNGKPKEEKSTKKAIEKSMEGKTTKVEDSRKPAYESVRTSLPGRPHRQHKWLQVCLVFHVYCLFVTFSGLLRACGWKTRQTWTLKMKCWWRSNGSISVFIGRVRGRVKDGW
jgi:hypothetical protein